MFFPIAGNSGFLNIRNLFEPSFNINAARISNSFQILFHPTPESRVLVGDNEPISNKFKDNIEDFSVNAFPVAFGDPTNKIIKSVTVGTDDNKVTAESIVNLQRIVDNENNNRTVTTDCSLLSVFEGRSYKAKLSTLGNAQISPMQFFFLKNHAIFTGLYQIMKVDHNITPNDMTTEFEGIKMRYASGGYGGVVPVTLDDYRKAADIIKNAPNQRGEVEGELGQDVAVEGGRSASEDGSIADGTVGSGAPLVDDSEVGKNSNLSVGRLTQSTTEIKIPTSVSSYFGSTSRFKEQIPESNNTTKGLVKKPEMIKRMNEFIADRIEGLSSFLNDNYPQWKGKIFISSAIRKNTNGSQHNWGEAIDISFAGTDVGYKLNNTHDLFNALLQYHRINNYEWDQILLETRVPSSVWIHWSYSRDNRINKRQNIYRMHGTVAGDSSKDKVVPGAGINKAPNGSIGNAAQTYTKSQSRTLDLAGNKT
jgi:hypothetical protein